jgi:D-threo-aldose 1-dehydrogenase
MTQVNFPSKFGFGGASLGNMYDVVDEETAEATLVAAWNSGVRFFDTAPVYGRGLGELRFGHVLRRYPRDEFVLSTKIGRLNRARMTSAHSALTLQGPSAGETAIFKGSLPFEVEVDYGYDAAMRSVEDSFQRLGVSHIDLVLVHDLGADHLGAAWEEQFELALKGSFRALAELRDQGVIKAWGLGNNVVEPLIRALERANPDIFMLAGRYTLLDQVALDQLFPMCAERDVPVVLGGTYNSDLLAGGHHYDYHDAPADLIAKRDRIAVICKRHGVDMRAVALQFCAAHPVVASVIPGAKSPVKVLQNAEFMKTPLPSGVWQDLKAEGFIRDDAPVPT